MPLNFLFAASAVAGALNNEVSPARTAVLGPVNAAPGEAAPQPVLITLPLAAPDAAPPPTWVPTRLRARGVPHDMHHAPSTASFAMCASTSDCYFPKCTAADRVLPAPVAYLCASSWRSWQPCTLPPRGRGGGLLTPLQLERVRLHAQWARDHARRGERGLQCLRSSSSTMLTWRSGRDASEGSNAGKEGTNEERVRACACRRRGRLPRARWSLSAHLQHPPARYLPLDGAQGRSLRRSAIRPPPLPLWLPPTPLSLLTPSAVASPPPCSRPRTPFPTSSAIPTL
ncbi:hypothetical protein FB451DRAFT_105274 [Mycena latifolia]|nr:hypothetical protein FB451DRAFT_105274 [Mycena latifolia]